MPNLKKLVEARVRKTGESWSTAVRHVKARRSGGSDDGSGGSGGSSGPPSDGFCPSCKQPVVAGQGRCQCGWLFIHNPFECLAHDDLTDHQRECIELELTAVAQTGPRDPDESEDDYARRVNLTMHQVYLESLFESPIE